MAGETSGDSGGRLHWLAQGRQRLVPDGRRAAAANPGFRRNVQHQPGDRSARGVARTRRGDRTRAERLGHSGMWAVLHQSGLILGLRSPAFSAFVEQLKARMADQPAQTMLNVGTLASYRQGLEHLHAHPGIQHLAGASQGMQQASPQLFTADVSLLLEGDELLQEEVFGPATLLIEIEDQAQLADAIKALRGQLTATLLGEPSELLAYGWLSDLLQEKVGRLLLNGYPTGVEVCDAMVHGGPYPATSDARGTSVGTLAIDRFLRPVCFKTTPMTSCPCAAKCQPIGPFATDRWGI